VCGYACVRARANECKQFRVEREWSLNGVSAVAQAVKDSIPLCDAKGTGCHSIVAMDTLAVT
jgi:hypothetical protein